MEYKSKFGIGEIVIYDPKQRGEKIQDALLEVTGIYFGMDNKIDYFCRYPATGMTVSFSESQLEGDPDYDQENGCYAPDKL